MGSGGRPRVVPAPRIVQIKLRLYPGRDDDLVDFFQNTEPGLRAARVKQALRSGIEEGGAVAEETDDVFDVMASLFE